MRQKLPVLVTRLKPALAIAMESGSFHRFEKRCLSSRDEGNLRTLAGRDVVIWSASDEVAVARALNDARAIADAGASSVGLALGTGGDVLHAVERGLRAGVARALPLADGARRAVVPHVGVVDGGALWRRLRAFVGRVLAEPSVSLDVMALWVLHCWCVEVARPFLVSPRLVLRGVDARADHARALRVLSWLVPMPLIASRAIARHVLEAVAAERPTLLIEDNDGGTLYRRDMRAALAAGALCDGQFLSARTKRNPTGRSPCFAPAAIATTMTLPEDLRLRSIVVPMAVAASAARRGPVLGAPDEEVFALRAERAAYADQAAASLSDATGALPRHVAGPALDNWAALLSIAAQLQGDVLARAATAAVTFAEADVAPTSNLALLADIRALVPLGDGDAGGVARIVKACGVGVDLSFTASAAQLHQVFSLGSDDGGWAHGSESCARVEDRCVREADVVGPEIRISLLVWDRHVLGRLAREDLGRGLLARIREVFVAAEVGPPA